MYNPNSMSFSLLSTKLYIPPARAGAVARSRLTDKLLSGVKHPQSVTLISGPAGFGKTTLLSDFVAWVQREPLVRAAWLSLDEEDNDPNRFWTYLITACQTVLTGVGETALELLRAPQPLPEDTIPTLLINDLAGQDHPLVLVLDDFHTIQNAPVNASMVFLLDHLPRNLHLIVSTRSDPPWPLARYRARNQLIEIRAQDLRFSTEEAAEFLNQTMELAVPAEAIAALEERTEGWIAGLQLAALSMQGRSDINAFIKAFTGSHVYIAEYLLDEVLKRQSREMQTFLLQTAVLDRLNAGLCQEITGCQDGQSMLKTLQQANIFIVPLDDEGRWFRYHHLFADLLKARLQSSLPKTAIGELHQRAAAWYEHSGMTAEAVDHALAAADYPRVVRLVEMIALPMILQANVRTVERWLQAIPAEFIEKSPRINMAYTWMNLLRGTFLQAIPFIDRLRNIFSQPESDQISPSLHAEWLAIQSELLITQGRPYESRELAKKAQEILPEVDPHVRSMIYLSLAKAYQLTLDYDRAAEIFQMIVQDARIKGDMTFEILGTSGQAQMVLKQGRLHRTFEIADKGIRRLEMSGKKVPFSATLYGELGQVYFQWHQLEQARTYLRRSMETSGKSGYSDPEIYHHIMLSKMCVMEGDLEGSVREMQQASYLAGIIPPAMVRENLIAQQVWVDLATDRPFDAEQLLEAEGFRFGKTFHFPDLDPDSPVALEAGLLYNSALRVLLYHSRRQQDQSNLKCGMALAGRVFTAEFQCQHLPVALETLLLLSQMHAALGDPEQSLAAAARALELAEPEGFISVFVEEGQPAADILSELLHSRFPAKVRPEYVQEILAAFPNLSGLPAETDQLPTTKLPARKAEMAGPPPSAAVPPLVEPLSARELEVLRLIAEGDSNQTIAEKLVITVSAVKKHTGNIYGKLAVNSRTQAVSRARQSGLLSSDD
jgi:LuxR family transcriptional regulator, maltose regulon positive regulatory protein